MPKDVEYFVLDDGLRILRKSCGDMVEEPKDGGSVADLSFRDPFEALVFAAYTDSFIPFDKNWGMMIRELGGPVSGDAASLLINRNLAFVDPTSLAGLPRMGWSYSLGEVLRAFRDYLGRSKHLVLVNSVGQVERKIAEIVGAGFQPEDYVIHCCDRGKLRERFFNYPAVCHFRAEGYLTGFWSPEHGSDLVAVKIPEYQRALAEAGFLRGAGGATFLELEAIPDIPVNQGYNESGLPMEYDMVYIEVECGVGLANRGSTGVGQKAHLCSETSEVYGVGPVRVFSNLRRRRLSGELRGRTYSRDEYTGTRFLRTERLGEVLFNKRGEKLVRKPESVGFSEADGTMLSYEYLLNLLFLSKLQIEVATKLVEAKSISELVTKAVDISFETILASLKSTYPLT